MGQRQDFKGAEEVEGVLELATRTLEQGLRGDARPLLCEDIALLLSARGAAHARLDGGTGWSQLCLWRHERPGIASVVCLEQPDQRAADGLRLGDDDWWLASSARLATLDWLSSKHVAEVPLMLSESRPSVLIIGRDQEFDIVQVRLLTQARRHLAAVDEIVDRLAASAAQPGDPRSPAQRTDVAWSPEVAEQYGSSPRAAPEGPLALDGLALGALTAREQEVLMMLSEGLLARSIAQRLAVSERTVHKHLGNLYKKLEAHDRLLAVRRAESLGLLPRQDARR